MTREEAIQWFKVINTKKFGWDEFALQESQREIRERCEQGIREAIDMAIEALSVKPQTDLISRADAIGAVQDHFNADGFKGYDDGQKMMDRIKALPSADAVHGEWIDVKNEPYCECSVCGSYIDNLDDDYAFCPRCGARMKGGAE